MLIRYYLVSLASPSQALEFIGFGLLHVLVLVDVQDELHFDGVDHADHPPVSTQFGFLSGTVHSGTQSSYITESPGQVAPPFDAGGLLQ